MDVLLRRFLRAGVRRGLAGNWYWFLLAGATFFLRRVLNDRRQRRLDRHGRAGRAGAHHGARPQRRTRHRSLTPVAGPFAAGERVLLIDPKDRRYLLTLVAGATFHTHAGVLAHDDIIGAAEGCTVTGSTGRSFLALRPTLSDVVLKMPRGRPGDLPEGPGRHPDRGGHRAGPARARGRRRLGRPLHDRPARRRVRRRLRAARGLRRRGPRPTWRPRSVRARPTGWRSAT